MPVAASAASPDVPRDGQPAPLRGLVLVSTPIGNLGDMSDRARAALGRMRLDPVRGYPPYRPACWRRWTFIPAPNPCTSTMRTPGSSRSWRGCGTTRRSRWFPTPGRPLVSDPGYRLVRAAIAAGLPVTAIPGPNAAVTALILSGLPPLPFLFLGFPPPKQAARRAAFSGLRAAERAGLAATLIWHEAPHRLLETLADLQDVFGDRNAAVARELTKRFETVERGKVSDLADIVHPRARTRRDHRC